MRLLICGDRNYDSPQKIAKFVSCLPKDTVIIEGEAKGADLQARAAAEFYCLQVLKFPANWKRYGRAAGCIRNQQMLDEGKPDFVVAFHNDFENSKGTKDMVKRAEKARILALVVHNDTTARAAYEILFT